MRPAGFHWFVAWRYLMARPRRVSPAVLAVAGVLSVVSTALSVIGAEVLRPDEPRVFVPRGGYEHLWIAAVAFFAVAGLSLVWALVRFAKRRPVSVGVPASGGGGLWLAGVTALALSAPEGLTRQVAMGLGVLSAGLVLGAMMVGGLRDRESARGPLLVGLIWVGVAVAAIAIADGLLDPQITLALPPPRMPLLPALASWLVAIGAGTVVTVRCMGQKPAGWPMLGITWTATLAAALLPFVARPGDEDSGAGLDALAALESPFTDDASVMLLAGIICTALAVLLFLGSAFLRVAGKPHHSRRSGGRGGGSLAAAVMKKQRQRSRWRQAAAGLLTAGGGGVFVSLLVMSHIEPTGAFFYSSGRPWLPLLLAAVSILVVAELTILLGVTRFIFTFFTTVSVAGVAIGSMALVIVLSVMSGFELDLRDKILGSNAHVLIEKESGSFTEYRDVAALLDGIEGVVAHTPYLMSEVVIAASSNYANVIIKGVDAETVGAVTELDDNAEQVDALSRLAPLVSADASPETSADTSPETSADTSPDTSIRDRLPDPPPDDMDVDVFGIDEPMDFSGDSSGSDAALAVSPEAAPEVDPPPADLAVDIADPVDFSGAGAGGLPEVADWPARSPDSLWDMPGDGDSDVIDALPSRPRTPSVRVPPRVALLPGVLVGRELVKQIHLYVGQEVRIVSPLPEDTPAGPVPRTRSLRVAGTFFTGMYEYDLKYVYVSLEALQEFLDVGDEVNGIEIRIADPDLTEGVLASLRAQLPPGYRVQDWKQINRSLFSALKLEKIAMFLILAIIILVASFSIVGNLVMVVVEKAREIALLKTLGASNFAVVQIFIAQGLCIGLVGTALGVSHGLLACVLGAIYGLPLDPEVYYIDRLPIHVEPLAIAAVACAGLAISAVATLYPAAVAARLLPLDGLRYD